MPKAARQPDFHRDRRRGWLTARDYKDIFRRGQSIFATRETFADLAKQYKIRVEHVYAIVRGACGLRHLGNVETVPSGIRRLKPKNRKAAVDERGISTQRVLFNRLNPNPERKKKGD